MTGERRRFTGGELVVASHNQGKIDEIAALLAGRPVRLLGAAELGLPEPEETGSTFAANAMLKARAAVAGSGKPSLADDSGIAVAALGGDPGIFSARWAGPNRDFMVAMGKVQDALGDNSDRRARFISVLALAWPDGHVELFEGTVDGTLVWPPRGTNGFGYDPMFVPEGRAQTFGEMTPDEKEKLSHRARSMKLLLDACF
ncbi:MAG: RdgB/HAM1 family non-canonical purine NTP pyrophosphatase [Alphaproteobacteria bacterium]